MTTSTERSADRPTAASLHDDTHTDDPRFAMLEDQRLTAMGLLVETFAGIHERTDRGLERAGLGNSSWEVMIRLARSPGRRLRMTELAMQSTLTSSGLTRMVDRLSKVGWVERVPCSTDRRGWYATLTDDGLEQVFAALPDHLQTVEESFTGLLDPEALESLILSLRALRAVVRPGSDPIVAAGAGST